MLAKQVEFNIGTGVTLLVARSRGQVPVTILSPLDRILVQVVAKKADAEKAGFSMAMPLAERGRMLAGKTIAVDSLNGVGHAFARYVLRKSGLDPERDVTIVPLEASAMPAALGAGRIDGFVQNPPWSSLSVWQGVGVEVVNPLAGDLSEFTRMPYQVVMTRAGYCEEHGEICRKFVAGIVKATVLIKTDIEAAVDAAQPFFKGQDRDLIRAGLKDLALAIPDRFAIDDDGFGRMQKFALESGQLKPQEESASFKGYYSNAYLP
jgi:ABC-type nitrate/sulfonate/bicarbonate transport system substrate-binding protein